MQCLKSAVYNLCKTFTPLRRFTTSHGATVRFMYASSKGDFSEVFKDSEQSKKISIVPDAVTQRVLNRSYLIDPQNRLYQDSVLVRFEDGKLNPKATFTALSAFLDIPYTESMTYCSLFGKRDVSSFEGNDIGFSTDAIYRTYDDYINDNERYYIEFFLRDAYQYYGYDFQVYDGKPLDKQKLVELISGFDTINYYIFQTHRKLYEHATIRHTDRDEEVSPNVAEQVRDMATKRRIDAFNQNRLNNGLILLEGLRFVNKNGQPLRMMPLLQLDPALLEQPLYH